MHFRNLFATMSIIISRFATPAFAVAHSGLLESLKHFTAASAVEGWYFRAVSCYPTAVTFIPVVLFKNDDY